MRPLSRAALAALLALPPAGGCSRNSEASSAPSVGGTLQKHEAARVRTRAVERSEMVRVLTTTTTVESVREVQVVAMRTGVVTELRVEQGDRVEAGDVLAVLDPRETELSLQDAQVAEREALDAVDRAEIARREAEGEAERLRLTYEAAGRKYERNEKARLISDQDLEQLAQERDTARSSYDNAKLAIERATIDLQAARTALERARLSLEQARVAHSHSRITAPYAGVIDSRAIELGGTATSGTAAFVLTDDQNLRARLYRPQRELALFTRGAGEGQEGGAGIEITATAEALPGRRFRGEIDRVSPSIDPDSGSFEVWIRLHAAEDGARLLPGMLLRLDIVVERHADALVVSKRALRREGDTTILFRVVDGRAERVVVREGFDDDERVEVLAAEGHALAEGDAVIVVGNREIEDGDEVEVDPGAAAAAPAGA